jgi:hypothetical protein
VAPDNQELPVASKLRNCCFAVSLYLLDRFKKRHSVCYMSLNVFSLLCTL